VPAKSSTTRPAVHRKKKKRSSNATVSAARLKRGAEVEALQAKLGLPVDDVRADEPAAPCHECPHSTKERAARPKLAIWFGTGSGNRWVYITAGT